LQLLIGHKVHAERSRLLVAGKSPGDHALEAAAGSARMCLAPTAISVVAVTIEAGLQW
jgi:hypothetical protein